MVPPTWAAALAVLQDDLPADGRAYIEATVEAEFGKPLSVRTLPLPRGSTAFVAKTLPFIAGFQELFSEFDFVAVASASVAQVQRTLAFCCAPTASLL